MDVLREHGGCEGGPDLVRAVGSLSLPEVDALAEALVSTPPIPAGDAPEHEVWPLVNARASLMSAGGQSLRQVGAPAGLDVLAAMSPREIGRSTFSTGVVRALLYSHGIVVEDPLTMSAELHLSAPEQTRHLSRRFLEAAALSL